MQVHLKLYLGVPLALHARVHNRSKGLTNAVRQPSDACAALVVISFSFLGASPGVGELELVPGPVHFGWGADCAVPPPDVLEHDQGFKADTNEPKSAPACLDCGFLDSFPTLTDAELSQGGALGKVLFTGNLACMVGPTSQKPVLTARKPKTLDEENHIRRCQEV